MKQVTISFSVKEYKELTKLVWLACPFLWGADDYKNLKTVDSVFHKICKQGLEQIPESGAFTADEGFEKPRWTVSQKIFDECEKLEEAHEKRVVLNHLVCEMAHRDFVSEYGKMEPEEIVANPDYVNFVLNRQNEYKQEFLFNKVDNLHLIKKE